MKKQFLYIIGIAMALFTACENISEDDRFIDLEGVTAKRKVLLEDYTGQACLNCPEAHEEAAALIHENEGNLIVVSIHAGTFGIAAPRGLMQPEGNEYALRYGIENYPSGVINRRSGALDYRLWRASIREEIQRESQLNLSITADTINNKLSVSATMLALEDISGKLQLWVIEDSIVAAQRLPNGSSVREYMHKHVFRATLNGTWGEDIVLEKGDEINTEPISVEIDENWIPKNLSIVAFVYNNTGVLQAEECKLIKEQ